MKALLVLTICKALKSFGMSLDYNSGTEVKKQDNIHVHQMGDDYIVISLKLSLNLNKVFSCRKGSFSPWEKGLWQPQLF